MSYVYIYQHPITQEPFYVGKGSGDRDQFHLNYACSKWDALTHYNPHLVRRIRRLLAEGVIPDIIRAQEGLSAEEAFKLEVELIARIGRKDQGTGPLLNLTRGGDGNRGYVFTETVRQEMSKSAIRFWQSPVGVELAKRNSQLFAGRTSPTKGNILSEETKQQISATRRAYFSTPESEITRERQRQASKAAHARGAYAHIDRSNQPQRRKGREVLEATREKLRVAALLRWSRKNGAIV